jgi:hypothetical protein
VENMALPVRLPHPLVASTPISTGPKALTQKLH